MDQGQLFTTVRLLKRTIFVKRVNDFQLLVNEYEGTLVTQY